VTALRPVCRFLVRAWWLQVKQFTTGSLFILTAVLQPVVFATIAFLMFHDAADRESPAYVALGAGLLGMWGATLFGSGAAITRHRFMGTLEGLVASPMPLVLVIAPITVASASLGLYSMLSTVGWGVLLFDVPLTVHSPVLLAVALLVTVVALGLLGLLVSAAFVLYPAANALARVVEFPIALLSGVLVPLSAVPGPLRPLGYLIAPMWGVKAIESAALGGASAVQPLLLCAATSLVYLALAVFLLDLLVRRARDSARLALT
jgi:ABC-2 type transport system permease protein